MPTVHQELGLHMWEDFSLALGANKEVKGPRAIMNVVANGYQSFEL